MTRADIERDIRADVEHGRRDLYLWRIIGWPATTKQLARRTGLSEITVRAWLKGRRSRRDTHERMVRALVDISYAR